MNEKQTRNYGIGTKPVGQLIETSNSRAKLEALFEEWKEGKPAEQLPGELESSPIVLPQTVPKQGKGSE